MDNKITKTRLSNFLSYEWIIMIVVALAGILLFEMAYTMLGVRLSAGQHFKVYYDVNFSASYTNSAKLESMIIDKKTYSYDILKSDYEIITGEADILGIRLSVQEGDIIITDSVEPSADATDKTIRSEHIVDSHDMYTMTGLLDDAKTYLKKFLKDGESGEDISYEKMDTAKIDAHFLERMRKDNRFRSDEQKKEGKILEQKRIEKLCKDVLDFEYFLTNAPEDSFYRYTRYTGRLKTATDEYKKELEKAYQKEIDEGRENAVYGINLGALKAGENDTSADEYFKLNGADSAKGSVIMAFDFLSYQPDLQFETLSYITEVLRECSEII